MTRDTGASVTLSRTSDGYIWTVVATPEVSSEALVKVALAALDSDLALRDKLEKAQPLGPVTIDSKDAAALLGLTDRRVRQLAESGDIRAARASNGRWLFTEDDVLHFKHTQTNG